MMSLEKKFIFVHIPKTAGCSISKALRDYSEDFIGLTNFDGERFQGLNVKNSKHRGLYTHARLCDYEKHFDVGEFFTFTCVRNPWDRLLSWYFFNLGMVDCFIQQKFIDLIKARGGTGLNPLLYSQHGFIQPGVDYVIYYEDIQEDFDSVCDTIGIQREQLSRMNSSKNSTIDYHDYYNDESKKLVETIFKDDIEYFKYKY